MEMVAVFVVIINLIYIINCNICSLPCAKLQRQITSKQYVTYT